MTAVYIPIIVLSAIVIIMSTISIRRSNKAMDAILARHSQIFEEGDLVELIEEDNGLINIAGLEKGVRGIVIPFPAGRVYTAIVNVEWLDTDVTGYDGRTGHIAVVAKSKLKLVHRKETP